MLPWQQAKYSSSAPDKGTQDKCDAPHLGNSNSLVLLLRQNMLSRWGLLTHICGCAGKKVKDCTQSPNHLFFSSLSISLSLLTHMHTQKYARRKQHYSKWHPYLWSPTIPPPSFKEKFLNVSGREFASHFQNAMAFGQLAPMRSRGGVEAGRERTRVKRGRETGVFSTRRLIAVFIPLAVGVLINDWRSQPQTITHSPLGGCTLGCVFSCDVARAGRSSGWRCSFSVMLSCGPAKAGEEALPVNFKFERRQQTNKQMKK